MLKHRSKLRGVLPGTSETDIAKAYVDEGILVTRKLRSTSPSIIRTRYKLAAR